MPADRVDQFRDMDNAIEEVQRLVQGKYPGIVLESSIQGWAYLGDFDAGIAAYSTLPNPTAKDDRWLGVCYFQRFEDMRAQEAFFRALARGEEAARVNLAHVLRFLERAEEAEQELSRVKIEQLSEYDQVLFHRVRSLHEETNGNIRSAVSFAEQAWESVQGLPEYPILAPSVLGQLGVLYARMGEARRALWYLELGIELTSGLEQQKVKLRRSTVLMNLGRLDEAASELESLGQLPEALELEREALRGEMKWRRQDFEASIDIYRRVVDSAGRSAGVDEMVPLLALAVLLTHTEQFSEAQEVLDQSKIVMSDRIDVLSHRFREIVLNTKRQEYPATNAASELEMLALEFCQLGTLQEEASVRLHLADLYLHLDDKRVQIELQRVSEICKTVHNNVFLQKEWVLLPELLDAAVVLQPAILDGLCKRVRVHTVGREAIMVNGKTVRLPLRRSVEILSYFLQFRKASLQRVVDDLFPGAKLRTAKSYFHQVRFQLRNYVPDVDIAFNPQSEQYEIREHSPVFWDVRVIRLAKSVHPGGRFLPSSTLPWVEKVNQEIEAESDLARA